MGHRGNAVFATDRVRDACRGGAVLGLAGTVGDGDERRGETLQSVKGVVDGADRRVPARREHFQGKQRRGHFFSCSPRDRADMAHDGRDAFTCVARTPGVTVGVRVWRGPSPSEGADGNGPRLICGMRMPVDTVRLPRLPELLGYLSYLAILARTALAAATRFSRLGQVSALPRVFRPQSGLIQTFSTSIFLRIS